MTGITEKARALYLIVLILFLTAVGFFVFDYYQLIQADEIFPFLKKKPAVVNQDEESPTEVEKLEFLKQKERLMEDIEEAKKIKTSLDQEKEKLEAEMEKVEQLKAGIKTKELESSQKIAEANDRKSRVRVMANKVANMPPDSAVSMMKNWNDIDIIEVFKQMDKDAEEEGRQTITTYLLTLFAPERRSAITTKWLDSDSARLPDDSQYMGTDGDS